MRRRAILLMLICGLAPCLVRAAEPAVSRSVLLIANEDMTDPRFREALHACDDPHAIRALFRTWLPALA